MVDIFILQEFVVLIGAILSVLAVALFAFPFSLLSFSVNLPAAVRFQNKLIIVHISY